VGNRFSISASIFFFTGFLFKEKLLFF
jgi:hypothetical protein